MSGPYALLYIIVQELLVDRFTGIVNSELDKSTPKALSVLSNTIVWLSDNPLAILVVILGAIVLHAYFTNGRVDFRPARTFERGTVLFESLKTDLEVALTESGGSNSILTFSPTGNITGVLSIAGDKILFTRDGLDSRRPVMVSWQVEGRS